LRFFVNYCHVASDVTTEEHIRNSKLHETSVVRRPYIKSAESNSRKVWFILWYGITMHDFQQIKC